MLEPSRVSVETLTAYSWLPFLDELEWSTGPHAQDSGAAGHERWGWEVPAIVTQIRKSAASAPHTLAISIL